MANSLFEIYRADLIRLTKSLVIKFTPDALAINRGLALAGDTPDSYDQSRWKYYQNLAGEYYVSDVSDRYSDLPMMVVSLDHPDAGQQLFSKSLLANNKLTRELYVPGSRYYNELVTRFPKQQNLIDGIIFPVDLATAVAAEDGDILSWDTSLVEDNEDNLIPELTAWVKGMYARWFNYDYQRVENLAWPAWLVDLYALMPGKIGAIRLSNAKSAYAHSHHIYQYLESNNHLGEFIPYLTKYQMLWLYRNLDYVRANAGISTTFDKLVDIILTERGLPLARYNLNLKGDSFDSDLLPDVFLTREAITFVQSGTGSDTRSVESIVRAESDITPMSDDEIVYHADKITAEAKFNDKSELPTKVLESAVIDRTDAVAFPLAEVLFYHWQWFAAQDTYNARISVVIPGSGNSVILTMMEAFYLWAYCSRKVRDEPTDYPLYDVIPYGVVRNIRNPVMPTKAELLAVVNVAGGDVLMQEVDYALETDYVPQAYFDADTFYADCSIIQSELMRHYELWASRENLHGHAQLAYMVSLFYFNREFAFPLSGTNYASWFLSKGIDMSDALPEEIEALAMNLVAQATGAGGNTNKSLRSVHRAMVTLFQRLSSYSIQVLRTINDSNEVVFNTPAVRYDNNIYGDGGLVTGNTKASLDNVRLPLLTVIGATNHTVADTTVGGGYIENGVEIQDASINRVQVVDIMVGGQWGYDSVKVTHDDIPTPAWTILEPWEDNLDLSQLPYNEVQEYTYPDQTP